ncbi:MAG: YggT family protein [candidate division KSB1 bacterium]|nr:YggT family protein [candidate division KSB1 bacterium]MDZ7346677.1 YggT family protein [candidate division KSB1 bacterium]
MGILVLHYLLSIYAYLIIAAAVLSWLPVNRQAAPVRLIERAVEPTLSVLRKIIPPLAGLDLSPAIALLLIMLIDRLLLSL